ncbi:MAG TPA: hypothetical protein VMV10_12845 [Pirellulales bacterium]|nr:hypothetical protein [Pirellulales bacterium]
MIRTRLVVELIAAAIALPCVGACSRPSSGYDRYVPSATQAEEALAEVLAAWQRGEPPRTLELMSAPIKVEVADSTRRPGQRLVGYELLGEVSGEGPRTFIVRLKLDNPSEEQDVRYYLVGVDPLWVFRQEDYDAVVHWDACEEPTAPGAQSQTTSAASIP